MTQKIAGERAAHHRSVNVDTLPGLLQALADGETVRVTTSLDDVPVLHLRPGQSLVGAHGGVRLAFRAGQDGVRLVSNNRIENLELFADANCRVVFNDTAIVDFGRLMLARLRLTGCVRIFAADRVRHGHVEVRDVDIVCADARGFMERPVGYGVEVIPGAFTLWNRQDVPATTITANLVGVRLGRAGAPVRGSGIFVAGNPGTDGRLLVRRLEVGEVHSDGGIAPGTADRISGGVFTVSGSVVDEVRIKGPVTTYGANDMVLDNWGNVDRWLVDGKITSHGPSAIGFVNFGTLRLLRVKTPIETFGQGARGFNVYDGDLDEADFDRIVTHGDGAIGIQISRSVGRITVRRGLETHGGVGPSLVKGVLTQLAATAFSLKPDGAVQTISITGGVVTHGEGVAALDLKGAVESLQIKGLAATAMEPP